MIWCGMVKRFLLHMEHGVPTFRVVPVCCSHCRTQTSTPDRVADFEVEVVGVVFVSQTVAIADTLNEMQQGVALLVSRSSETDVEVELKHTVAAIIAANVFFCGSEQSFE